MNKTILININNFIWLLIDTYQEAVVEIEKIEKQKSIMPSLSEDGSPVVKKQKRDKRKRLVVLAAVADKHRLSLNPIVQLSLNQPLSQPPAQSPAHLPAEQGLIQTETIQVTALDSLTFNIEELKEKIDALSLMMDKRLMKLDKMVQFNFASQGPGTAHERNSWSHVQPTDTATIHLAGEDGEGQPAGYVSDSIIKKSPRKKPSISEVNCVKRLKFAKEYVNKPSSFWQTVIFSNKSKFNLFGSDGHGYIWRKKNSELEAKNLLPTVKFGGGKVLVWGCMAAKGVRNLEFIKGNMTAQMYIDILRANLKSSACKLGLQNSFSFQQDNDPKHTAHISRKFLRINAPCQLVTPPQSPDMNPIENLWSLLEVAICKCKISNKENLKRVLRTAWSKICPRVTAALVDSMPRRLQAIIDAKGMHTKY
ncbi:hypothetical protein V9T40_006954 [Parthenolecanium corni]|uniref:Tc1-like transposase DDE domain-containing protein n=1 Tax=Parthenolecanium corni TaxID=536013 RepID=A0AAN9TVI6_9HEMI